MLPLKDNLPTDRLPIVTIVLIAANVVVYFVLQGGAITHGPHDAHAVGVGVVDSLLVSGGILQLLGNIWFLGIFGVSVEDSMSRWRYGLLYVLGGLVALGLQTALAPGRDLPVYSSSGAVAAVLGAYTLLYARARVATMVCLIVYFTLLELPAALLLGGWFAEQALVTTTSLGGLAREGGWAAFGAQAGGFVFGLLAITLLCQRRKQVPSRVAGVPA